MYVISEGCVWFLFSDRNYKRGLNDYLSAKLHCQSYQATITVRNGMDFVEICIDLATRPRAASQKSNRTNMLIHFLPLFIALHQKKLVKNLRGKRRDQTEAGRRVCQRHEMVTGVASIATGVGKSTGDPLKIRLSCAVSTGYQSRAFCRTPFQTPAQHLPYT